jgi:DNA-directed RNA polymerase subunit RPC12/RpoP
MPDDFDSDGSGVSMSAYTCADCRTLWQIPSRDVSASYPVLCPWCGVPAEETYNAD